MKDHGFVYEISIRLVPWLLYWLMQLLFATCRVTSHGEHYLTKAMANGRSVIGAFWHYSFLLAFGRLRHYSCVAMVSSSRDGEYLVRLLKRFHCDAVRGSRHRGGVTALKELIRHAQAGKHCAIIADGSQGPALQAQPGSILLAARSGGQVLPIVCTANRYWIINSWDRTVIPKPFSHIEAYFGETIEVPANADGAVVEHYRFLLEQRLLELYRLAWRSRGKEAH